MSSRLAPAALIAIAALTACHLRVSPLAAAARRGDLAAIETLLSQGANPHEGSGVNGWTPLLHALHKNQEQAALRLMRESSGPSTELDQALFMAAGYAQTEMVEALLARGADPHALVDGATPLENAVRGAFDIDYRYKGCDAHTATVRALLAAAPDLATAGSDARKAAEQHGCSEMLALLK